MSPLPQSRDAQIEALLNFAAVATPLQSDLGQCFVSLPLRSEAHQIIPLHSPAFRNWLVHQFYSAHETIPRPSAVRDVVQLLEAKTQFGEAARVQVSRRIASLPGTVLLDLYNATGEIVEITSQGWHIAQNLGAHFRTTRSARPLPVPETSPLDSPAVFEKIRARLNLTPEHFTQCMSWLTAALLPAGPYPILVLQGPPGPGKSALAMLLRSLVDPGPTPFCPAPRSSRDLQSLASHNWVIALDNIEQLSSRMLRQTIRLATGEVFPARDRPSDPEPFHLFLQRPLLLTTSQTLSAELARHAITIDAPDYIFDCEHLRPAILGALCSTVSAELANPTVRSLKPVPNAIAAAVCTALGGQTHWTGTATELLVNLQSVDFSIQWPGTPKGLTQLLHKTPLGNIDFQSLKNSQGRRSVELNKIPPIDKDAQMRRTVGVQPCSPVAQSPPACGKIEASIRRMKPLALLTLAAVTLFSQSPPDAAKLADAEKLKEEIEQGTPITSDLVRNACGACHKSDDKLRMSRISYRRTTPEGWERTIKRMVSLNGVHLEPAQARDILKYLSTNLGLAPEEVKPGAFEVENRMIEYKYTADKDTEQTCTKCHSFGRVLLQRRTKTEWELLIAMHRGYYPLSDFQAFRRMNPIQTLPGPDGRPPDNRHPMEKAIAHLSTAFPLKTPEWSAWSANMRAPKLAGRWAASGYQPGKGPIYGIVEIKASRQADDEFTTQSHLVYARSGQKLDRAGKGLVYTGFEWRGRSDTTKEVMFVDRNMREITGRWFSGAYDEIGTDIKLQRIGNDPVVLGLNRTALKTGATIPVDIHGINFPANLAAGAIDFGRGIKVGRLVSATPGLVKVEVSVDKTASIGARDVFVAGAALPAAAVVYDKIDVIKVMPQAGMARIGGIVFPKQYQQFEAIAFSNGPDGKPDTKDDLNLGPVDVAWSVEEYTATFGDDDKEYVGTLDDNGLFTPNVDGPNPKRRNNADNYGDVWVVATYSKDGKPVRGRAHLLVTVPLYIKWDML